MVEDKEKICPGISEVFSSFPPLLPPPFFFWSQTSAAIAVNFSSSSSSPELICYCSGHCPGPDPDATNGTCVTKPGGYCYASVEEVHDFERNVYVPERSYGCLPPEEDGFMQCKGHLVPHTIPQSILCCSHSNLCNQNLRPSYVDRRQPAIPADHTLLVMYIVVPLCFVIALAISTLVILGCRKKKGVMLLEDGESIGGKSTSMKPYVEQSIESGSGSGSEFPLLVQRTIARQTDMIRSVGKGRYGEVWKGVYRQDSVAVKVFLTTEEASWLREHEIYQTPLLSHDNILGFIAADIDGTGSLTRLLLITDFHENGSLYDYLQNHVLDEQSMLVLMQSAVDGLCHLHTEIVGKQVKPSIAHRDIKSKNILVTKNGTCVLADFGLAVCYKSQTKEIDIAPNARSGTKRYMAPEVLDESINRECFDAYKCADIYSMSLVMWEIARRCAVNGVVEESQVPYYDCVPNDPTFEDMKKVVCVDGMRPKFSPYVENSHVLTAVTKMIAECWHTTPRIRLSALRVKKNLKKLVAHAK